MSRILTGAVLATVLAFGAYSAFDPIGRNGVAPAILKTHVVPASERYCPGAPTPFRDTYTGITLLDDEVRTLVCFFAIIVQGPQKEDVPWASLYLFVQLFGSWALITLEGLRRGNRGRLVSWTGVLGFIFQRATYTICVPTWLIIHLLTSPISSSAVTAADLSVDAADLWSLPLDLIAAYVVPTIMIALPAPGLVSASFHYTWNVIWQFFPALQSLYHWVCTRLVAPTRNVPQVTTKTIYRLVLGVSILSQLAIYAHVLASTTPAATHWARTLGQILLPYWAWNSPVVGPEATQVAGVQGLADLVKLFLQWDIYSGCVALVVWACHVYLVAVPGKTSKRLHVLGGVLQVAFYLLLGGPAAVAAKLLSERDDALLLGGGKKQQPAAAKGPKTKRK